MIASLLLPAVSVSCRQLYHIDQSSITAIFPEIGLINGSTCSFSFTDADPDSFFIALVDSDEYSGLPHRSFSYASQFCSRTNSHFANVNSTVFTHLREADILLPVQKPDTYRPLVVSCRSEISRYALVIEFKNGDSLLDSRRLPSFVVMPIELICLALLILSWAINQILFRQGVVSLQYAITITMVLGSLTVSANYLVLWSESLRDDTTFLHLAQHLCHMLFEISLYSTLILAAKGWCIVVRRVSTSDVTEIVLYCSILFIFRVLYAKIQLTVFAICMFALTAGVMFLLWLSLVNGIRYVDKRILAHMKVILNAGINPYSTPIYFKHIIYTFLVHVTVIYFSGNVVVMSLEIAGSLHAWVKDMLLWILNVGLLCSFGFLFRSRKADCTTYMRFEGGEELDIEELKSLDEEALGDVEGIGLVEWTEGMELPPPPVLVPERDAHMRPPDGLLNTAE
jgi:hypothetical protein